MPEKDKTIQEQSKENIENALVLENSQIVEWKDVMRSIAQYIDFKKTNDLTLDSLQEARNEREELRSTSHADQINRLARVEQVYENLENKAITQLVMEYVTMQIGQNQVPIKEYFNFLTERINLINEAHGDVFDNDDRLAMALDMLKLTKANLAQQTTIFFDESEKAKLIKRMEAKKAMDDINKLKNRNFNRLALSEKEKTKLK